MPASQRYWMPLREPSATATGHGITWAMRSTAIVRAMRAWVLRGASAGSASRPPWAGHEAGPACDRNDHEAAWACDRNAEISRAPGALGWRRGARYVTVRSAAAGGRWGAHPGKSAPKWPITLSAFLLTTLFPS